MKKVEKAKEFIEEYWSDSANKVISACEMVSPFNGDLKSFLSHCTACGGDWVSMVLSGIKELWPTVWESIPEDMGDYSFFILQDVLILCGVE